MRTEQISHHYSRQFNEDLEALRTNVLEMGGLVEKQLRRAIKALVKGDSDLGEKVARDDVKVNSLEVAIDEECNQVIAAIFGSLSRSSSPSTIWSGSATRPRRSASWLLDWLRRSGQRAATRK